MKYVRLATFLVAALLLTGGLTAQENPAKKKEEPKKEEPKKEDPKKDATKKEEPKKEDPLTKAKGQLPANWAKLGLTDEQKDKVYRVQMKHNNEIAKLEAQIDDIKKKRDKERAEVLTPEQKKRLEEIAKIKSGVDK